MSGRLPKGVLLNPAVRCRDRPPPVCPAQQTMVQVQKPLKEGQEEREREKERERERERGRERRRDTASTCR